MESPPRPWRRLLAAALLPLLWACDLLAPSYAPEIDFAAALASEPGVDLWSFARHSVTGINRNTGILVVVMLLAQHDWHRGDAPVESLLRNEPPWQVSDEAQRFLDAGCVSEITEFFLAVDDIGAVFQPGPLAALQAGRAEDVRPWSCYLRDNSVIETERVHRTRRTPMLFQLAQNDDLIPPEDHRRYFETLCERGYALDYLECAGVTHTQGIFDSLPEQAWWLAERLAGAPIPAGDLCRQRPAVTCSGNSPL